MDITEEKFELEEQFILRLPPNYAKVVSDVLHTKPKKIKKLLKIELDVANSSASVHVGKTVLKAKLLDLPTIVESYKTTDRVNIFKTADISQVLVCGDDKLNLKTSLNDGLAPPLKNVKKKRFRKTLCNEDQALEAENIEKELRHLLRADSEAISTRYEILYEDSKVDLSNKEIILFGNLSSDSDESQ